MNKRHLSLRRDMECGVPDGLERHFGERTIDPVYQGLAFNLDPPIGVDEPTLVSGTESE